MKENTAVTAIAMYKLKTGAFFGAPVFILLKLRGGFKDFSV